MSPDDVEVSIVLPCLNEESTVAGCVRSALQALTDGGLSGEVIVADNGSSDRTGEVALREGARVVDVPQQGYGNALRAGMKQARGRFIVFLDADLSYDPGEALKFVEKLRQGADLVIGTRFRGGIDAGAMPWLHRVFGTPFLTALANLLFRCGISDINCGMRALTKDAFDRLDLRSEGMEFASEMMVKAARARMRIDEVPIRFHMDQRGRRPHLRSFRDGWRHLQLMMHFCSVWLFLLPGLALVLLAVFLIQAAFGPPVALLTYLAALCCATLGIDILLLGVTTQGRVPSPKYARWRNTWLYRILANAIRIEKGLAVGAGVTALGAALLADAVWRTVLELRPGDRISVEFDSITMKLAMVGAMLLLGGLQVFFTSLFLGLFGIRVADDEPQRR